MADAPSTSTDTARPASTVLIASLLILFLEMTLIRWIPGHVRVVAYFTNLVLLACFLGMGAGCLMVRVKRPLVYLAPPALAVVVLLTRGFADIAIDPIGDDSQHLWLQYGDLPENVRRLGIPTVLCLFFAALSILFLGLGHAFGIAFARMRALSAYSIDIVGSLAGTLGFAALCYFETPPLAWFAVSALLFLLLLRPRTIPAGVAALVFVAACVTAFIGEGDSIWSRYYRISYTKKPGGLAVNVNASFHQFAVHMTPQAVASRPAMRDVLRKFSQPYRYARPKNVLILGAGTGNDVLVARANGAERITAVEIDPAIARLGREQNDARPYDADNVRVVIDDARSFLKKSREQFDLIVFGTLDSQALLSGLSTLRLENYVYTRECFSDVRRRLAPGGLVATYYSVMKPWIVPRLIAAQHQAFGEYPIVLSQEDKFLFNLIMLQGGGSGMPLPEARRARPSDAEADPTLIPTDDWPFLYMQARRIPPDVLWVIAFGIAWTLLLTGIALRGQLVSFSPAFFFLGAGFMLIEAKGITETSLLFGATWQVNILVISGVLAMILLANATLMRWNIGKVDALFAAVIVCLALRGLFPVADLVREFGPLQHGLAVLRVGAPVFFAGLIFGALLSRAKLTSAALGANLVGAMVGGFSEHLSTLFGMRALDGLALAFYVLAWISARARPRPEPATVPVSGPSNA